MAIAKDVIEVGNVRITHPDRVLFPDDGVTKGDVAQYYAAAARAMLPHLQERPLSLLRCPDGIGSCFFQKHLTAGLSKTVRQIPIHEKQGAKLYPAIDTAAGLLELVQMGAIEFHLWGSTVDHLEKPDRLIFDLDPDEGLGWDKVIAAALALRDFLAAVDLRSFAKTTGGKGLHVVVPMRPTMDWEEAKTFSRAVVRKLAAAAPELYTASLAKTARRGRIFIDYLRNGRGATAVAPYSLRARPGATVAAPVSWTEIERAVRPDAFTIFTMPARLSSLKNDPWKDLTTERQTISAALRRKVDGKGDRQRNRSLS